MRLGYIVEGHDVPAKSEEEIRAEGDECPEGKLQAKSSQQCRLGIATSSRRKRTHHGDNVGLHQCGKREELQVERQVELVMHLIS